MYRKFKVLEMGGYVPLKRKEDFDLFSRMLSSGCQAANIGEALYLTGRRKITMQEEKAGRIFKCALYVYWRHLMRRGCSLGDYMIICGAEFIFMMLPDKAMKKVSDRLLRETKGTWYKDENR